MHKIFGPIAGSNQWSCVGNWSNILRVWLRLLLLLGLVLRLTCGILRCYTGISVDDLGLEMYTRRTGIMDVLRLLVKMLQMLGHFFTEYRLVLKLSIEVLGVLG